MNPKQIKVNELLKEFIQLTEKHNLKYVAMFGTLLGAIRHDGFIPWDDDIDLVIDIDTYNFLMQNYPEKMKTSDNSDNFIMAAKYTNDDENDPDAVFLDLFVAIPSNWEKAKTFYSLKNKISYVKGLTKRKMFNIQIGLKMLKLVAWPTWFAKKLTFNKVMPKLLVEGSKDYFLPSWPTKGETKRNFVSGVDIFDIEKHTFVDYQINIPKDYEKLLVSFYGKNWKTPIKFVMSEHLGLYDIKVMCLNKKKIYK